MSTSHVEYCPRVLDPRNSKRIYFTVSLMREVGFFRNSIEVKCH